jgi:hypothetical protein
LSNVHLGHRALDADEGDKVAGDNREEVAGVVRRWEHGIEIDATPEIYHPDPTGPRLQPRSWHADILPRVYDVISPDLGHLPDGDRLGRSTTRRRPEDRWFWRSSSRDSA